MCLAQSKPKVKGIKNTNRNKDISVYKAMCLQTVDKEGLTKQEHKKQTGFDNNNRLRFQVSVDAAAILKGLKSVQISGLLLCIFRLRLSSRTIVQLPLP